MEEMEFILQFSFTAACSTFKFKKEKKSCVIYMDFLVAFSFLLFLSCHEYLDIVQVWSNWVWSLQSSFKTYIP